MTTYTVQLEENGPQYTGLSDATAAEILELDVPSLLRIIQQYGICSTQDGLAVEDGTDIKEAIRNFQEMSS